MLEGTTSYTSTVKSGKLTHRFSQGVCREHLTITNNINQTVPVWTKLIACNNLHWETRSNLWPLQFPTTKHMKKKKKQKRNEKVEDCCAASTPRPICIQSAQNPAHSNVSSLLSDKMIPTLTRNHIHWPLMHTLELQTGRSDH